MPARSNEFQRFIRQLEEHLAADGASVTESALIPDLHDGTKREVDILVRIPVAGRDIVIGIETRDQKKKGDLPWIEQLKARYDLLPVDRVVAVSRRGFSKAAKAKAALYKIDLLTIDSAQSLQWVPRVLRFARVEMQTMEFELAAAALHLRQLPDVPWPPKFLPNVDPTITQGDSRRATLKQIIKRGIIENGPVNDQMSKLFAGRTEGRVHITLQFAASSVIHDANGLEIPITGVTVPVKRRSRTASATLKHGAYRGTAVASGVSDDKELPFSITLAENEGGILKARAAFPAGPEARMVEFKFDDWNTVQWPNVDDLSN